MSRAKPISAWLLMDAAMCAWESVLDELATQAKPNKWKRLQDQVGYAEMRDRIRQLAEPIHNIYTACVEATEYSECFDWHFVPEFLEHATDDDCALRPDAAAIMQRLCIFENQRLNSRSRA